nr:hypothetical protein [Tanacetum cinerariifolium]
VKIVNHDVRIQALVDGKKVVVNEASIRRDLILDDAEGTACLPNVAIFKELAKIGAKTTAWNKFSSIVASAIIFLANNKKFNFSKCILENLVNNLEVRVPTSSHDPLPSGEDRMPLNELIEIEIYADEDLSLINETAQDHGRMNDQDLFKVHDLDSDEVFVDVTTAKNVEQDAIVTGKGITTFKDIKVTAAAATTSQISKDELTLAHNLMEIKSAKPKAKKEPDKPLKKKYQIALDEEVARKLKAEMKAKMDEEERIAKEKNEANIVKIVNHDVRIQALVDGKKVVVNEASIRRDLRLDDAEGTACLPNAAIFKELAKIGVPTSSHDPLPSGEDRMPLNELIEIGTKLSDKEDASKQERIAEIYADEDLSLINETAQDHGRMNDQDLFRVHDLDSDEVFVDVTTAKNVEQDAIVTGKDITTIKDIKVTAAAATTSKISKDELTLAHNLMEIKSAKPKAKKEPDKPLKKKYQIALDEEVARKLEAEMKAKMDEEERIAKEKNEANIVMIEEWDDV